MRKLYSFTMVTLDGFFEGLNQNIDWHTVDEEFNVFAAEQLRDTDTIMFGRVTYEGMASYWPTAGAIEDDPTIAAQMNSVAKIVVSRTLDRADWNNTRLITDNLVEEITKLKQQPGKDVAIFGSANLTASLMRLHLVDELRLMVNPVVLGRGTPLFQGIDQPLGLTLIASRVFGSGNVLLHYELQHPL